MSKIILGIESSCDETAAAVLQQDGSQIKVLSNVVATSLEIQSKWGGVVPEQAAREQLKSIIPVIIEALEQANLTKDDLDSIAVTQGPGLIGSLLIGVETAKTLSLIWHKPLIPVNHLIGHFYANWISQPSAFSQQLASSARQDLGEAGRSGPSAKTKKADSRQLISGACELRSYADSSIPTFPCLGLLVSGGHTDIILFKNHGDYQYLGGTRDDAAGECFDKTARLLGLSYPGGPQISEHAKSGNQQNFPLPKPMLDSGDLDFSFSGLKTAVANLVKKLTAYSPQLSANQINDLCASIEHTIAEVLTQKIVKASQITGIDQLIVAGGVAANEYLKNMLIDQFPGQVFIPPVKLCTDNAAMIAAAAFFLKPIKSPLDLQANPNLSLAT